MSVASAPAGAFTRGAFGKPELPSWPLTALLAGFPVWWILGIGELSWTLAGAVMLVLLARAGRWKVPRGFGIVLLFLLWVGLSVVGLDSFGRLLGFLFRYAQYIGIAVAFVYVYNARELLPGRRIYGLLTMLWVWVVAGGYLGLAFPDAVVRTPLAYVLPDALLSNDLVRDMAVRRLTQFNPDAWTYIDPRPSAPFLYTNNWGNAYSLLLPFVVLYIAQVGRGWRRTLLALAVPISFVPAFLTLNRGMFLGLGVVLVYLMVRFVLSGQRVALLISFGVGLLGALAVWLLPVWDRLNNRLEGSGTNESRLAVYQETIRRTMEAPLFGFGGPRPVENSVSIVPPAGTQGQLWMVTFSHGFVGAALFVAMLVWMTVRAVRSSSFEGAVAGGVLVASMVEIFYYGTLGAGLFIAFVAGALAFREHAEPLNEPTIEEMRHA